MHWPWSPPEGKENGIWKNSLLQSKIKQISVRCHVEDIVWVIIDKDLGVQVCRS